MPGQAREYLGVGVRYPLSFSTVGGLKKNFGVSIDSDIDRIRSSLAHIFSVGIGERPMRRNFGSNLRRLVFMPLDSNLYALIDLYVRRAVELYEPRISDINVTIDSETRRKEGVLEIDIQFTIIKTNVTGNFVFPFYLNNSEIKVYTES